MATKGIQGRRVTDDVGLVSIVVMPAWLKRILQAFGVDKAIGYSSLARIIQAAGGAFTIFFVAANLTSEEQGYYYTFGSLLAVQIFFDLGVNFTISQYVAYEYAFLKDNPSGTLEGGASHLSRLASLFRLFSKWYLVAAILLLFVLLVSGYYFFAINDTGNVNWLLPWILLAVSTSLNLLISPYLSMLEGMGKVKDVAFMRLIAQILHIVTVWGVLLSGGKLFSSGLSSFCLFSVSLIFLIVKAKKLFRQLWKEPITEKVSYVKEIFPFQWRMALSSIGGYLIFQLFNPVLFAYSGAVVAGQMGMTLTVLNGILALTLSWTTTKAPFWAAYISRKEYALLNVSFRSTFRNTIVVCSSCLLIFALFIGILYYYDCPIVVRFLPFHLIALLMLVFLCNSIINVWATYLRCHKKEPFLIQAILIGILCCISTFMFGKYVGVEGVVGGYTFITLCISLPLSYIIFIKNRNKYHNE